MALWTAVKPVPRRASAARKVRHDLRHTLIQLLIRHAASHQRPPCESALCHFSADRHFPLFARRQRLARANGPKSRRMRTASESLGGISVAKSRTVGLNSPPRRPTGRRLKLPGCVDTPMDGGLGSDSLVAGNFPCLSAFLVGLPARKGRQVRGFLHFPRYLPAKSAGNFRPRCREFGITRQGIFAGAAGAAGAKGSRMKNRPASSSGSPPDGGGSGYGRPPVSSRWKAGQSGNPRGRRLTVPVHSEQLASDPEIEPKVGYRQPPRHSRWKPGQSGNPGGGPRRDILEEVLLSPFPVKIGRTTEMVAALDVMLLRIRAKAMAGDQQVIRSLIEHFGSPKLQSELTRRSRK
jgi:hypothetical protein